MDPKQLKVSIEKDLVKKLIDSRILLDRFRVIDESSRKTSAYTDPYYIPFYYHLGKYVFPKKMFEIGFRLGLFSGSFLTSCKTVEKFVAFQQHQENIFYSPKLGCGNIKKTYTNDFNYHVGEIFDKPFEKMLEGKWDFVIINEELNYEKHRTYFEFVWERMELDGIIIVDYVNFHGPVKTAFQDFCKIVNREPVICKTRYGTGLIQR